MKDPVFAGKDVAEAVRVASRTLAVSESSLRYVVLDPGHPGGRGLSPTEARIAVLIERLMTAGGAEPARGNAPAAEAEADWDQGRDRSRPRREARRRGHEAPPTEDPDAGVRAVVREIARAAGVELSVDVSAERDRVEVHLEGPGTRLFFDPQGEALGALEHLLERQYARARGAGQRVRLRCAGQREYRDELLREQARELAEHVRGDGQARTTTPLNAYERRVIHLALEGQDDVTTFSVGEGAGRRVTIAPRDRASEARPGNQPGAPQPPGPSPADGREPALPQAGARATPVEPTRRPTPAAPATFDHKRFDRPPQGGGASELM